MSRIMNWIERDNARSDAVLASRPTRWLIIRALLGPIFAAKGISILMNATHAWEYVAGPLLIAGGVFFVFESANILLARYRARKAD